MDNSQVKKLIKNTLGYGIALELMGIGAGYWLYRKYTTDESNETLDCFSSTSKFNRTIKFFLIF